MTGMCWLGLYCMQFARGSADVWLYYMFRSQSSQWISCVSNQCSFSQVRSARAPICIGTKLLAVYWDGLWLIKDVAKIFCIQNPNKMIQLWDLKGVFLFGLPFVFKNSFLCVGKGLFASYHSMGLPHSCCCFSSGLFTEVSPTVKSYILANPGSSEKLSHKSGCWEDF